MIKIKKHTFNLWIKLKTIIMTIFLIIKKISVLANQVQIREQLLQQVLDTSTYWCMMLSKNRGKYRAFKI